jgi:hypothetical protein
MPDENDSNTPRTDREFKLPPQRPVTPSAPLQRALPDDGKRKADDTKNKADELAREFRIAEKWVIGTNITLALIGVIALCIYYGQLSVMRGQFGEIIRQFPEIQKSAKAAQDSADWSRKTFEESARNFRLDERAWLAPEFPRSQNMPIGPNGMAFAYLGVNNFGKTEALGIHGKLAVAIIPKEAKNLPFEAARTTPFNPTAIFPNSPQSYGIPVVRQLKNGGWGAVEWSEITPQLHRDDTFLFGYGKIYYSDIFGNAQHVVTFCQLLVGGFAPTKVAEPYSGFELRQQCADYNRAYDEP